MSGGICSLNTRSIGVSRDMEMAALRLPERSSDLLQPAYAEGA